MTPLDQATEEEEEEDGEEARRCEGQLLLGILTEDDYALGRVPPV